MRNEIFEHPFFKPLDLMKREDIRFHARGRYGLFENGRCRVCGVQTARTKLHEIPDNCDPKRVMRFVAGHKKFSLVFSDVSLIMRDYSDGAPASASEARQRNLDYFRSLVALHEGGVKIVRVTDEIWAPQWLYELAKETDTIPSELFWAVARQLKNGERTLG